MSRIEEPFITAIQTGVAIPVRAGDQHRWNVRAPAELQQPPVTARLHSRFGTRLISLAQTNMPIDNPNITREQFQNLVANRRTFMLWSIECGWPMVCVGGERWYEHRGVTATPVQYSGMKLGILRLPSRLLWAGLIVNAVLFAAATLVVWTLPQLILRAVRRRRGQCPQCGYPVGVSPVCTECGTPVLNNPR